MKNIKSINEFLYESTSWDIDDFFRRMHIDNDAKVDGKIIDVPLLIELLDKFASEQIKKYNKPLSVYNCRRCGKPADYNGGLCIDCKNVFFTE